jgi:hypothetical protein
LLKSITAELASINTQRKDTTVFFFDSALVSFFASAIIQVISAESELSRRVH